GLADEGIAAGNRHAEHPHRDHGGEIERRDTGNDAKGLTHRVHVDAGARAFREFALLKMRDTAGELDHLKAALHVAARVRKDLAMLGRKHGRKLIHIGFEKALEFEHHAGAALRIRRRPARKRLRRHLDRRPEFRRAGKRRSGRDLARIRICYVTETAAAAPDALAADEMREFLDHGEYLLSGRLTLV